MLEAVPGKAFEQTSILFRIGFVQSPEKELWPWQFEQKLLDFFLFCDYYSHKSV